MIGSFLINSTPMWNASFLYIHDCYIMYIISDKEMTSSKQPNSFACRDCQKVFGKSFLLKKHNINVHGGSFTFDCPVCEKEFSSKFELMSHHRACKVGASYIVDDTESVTSEDKIPPGMVSVLCDIESLEKYLVSHPKSGKYFRCANADQKKKRVISVSVSIGRLIEENGYYPSKDSVRRLSQILGNLLVVDKAKIKLSISSGLRHRRRRCPQIKKNSKTITNNDAGE